MRHRPYFLVGPGQALVPLPLVGREAPLESEGMERRTALVFGVPPFGRLRVLRNALAIRRSTCGDFCPWTRTSVPRVIRPCGPTRIREAFASLHPDAVQPLKAAPRSRSGRAPRASRGRGANPPAGAARPKLSPRLRAAVVRGESPPRRPGCSTSGSPLDGAPHEQVRGI